MKVDKAIEFMKVEWPAPEVNVGPDAIFLCFPFPVMMVMMVAMLIAMMSRFPMLRFMLMAVDMVIFIVVILMIVMMMFFMVMIFMLQLFLGRTLDFLHPGRRGGDVFKVKGMCVDDLIERNVAVITFNYTCFRL